MIELRFFVWNGRVVWTPDCTMLYQKLARMTLAVYGIDGERAVIPTQIKAKDIDCP